MISTLEIKKQQLTNGTFTTGTGKEVILIMGSCRSIPYLNYMDLWNNMYGNRFTIHYLDPHNWNWNLKNDFVDYHKEIEKQEKNTNLLSILSTVNIFIHEYYKNYGMFNTIEDGEKSIYDFGINPEIDICVPNFNDLFILFNDIVSFDTEIKKKAQADYRAFGKLSESTEKEIYEIGKANIEKFYSVCRMSDLPGMEEYFRNSFAKVRLFWTSNHISKYFSLSAFYHINKILNLNVPNEYWNEISKEDIFANNYTYLTKYDIKYFGYQWEEEIKELTI